MYSIIVLSVMFKTDKLYIHSLSKREARNRSRNVETARRSKRQNGNRKTDTATSIIYNSTIQ